VRLQLGDVVELVEKRPKQTEQARKRKLGLRLGACDTQNRHLVAPRHRKVE
jgi:hypothetical protein